MPNINTANNSAALLSPAGGPEAGYAAIQYGADALYCGLRGFSARAEAVNFSPDELAQLCWHAHTRPRRRSVFVALNTLALESELPQIADSIIAAKEAGADALIIQDLGVAALAKELAPEMELHASTQLAIHNLEGARAAVKLGFGQVTLARELTLREIAEIAAAGIKTEVFIHGALCYSYSGLCLMGAVRDSRSGNRGACSYPCRAPWRRADSATGDLSRETAARGEPCLAFSMKDLALGPEILRLAEAGVNCLKIEGRMKSPLYVAAVTDFYRRALDGAFESEREMLAAFEDTQTIFSRAQTAYNLHGVSRADAIDPIRTGHQGALIGETSRRPPPPNSIEFESSRALEVRDGIQLEIPNEKKPFGFSIAKIFRNRDFRRPVFETQAGDFVSIELPPDAPRVPAGTPVFCASSQAVKRKFHTAIPPESELKPRKPLALTLTITPRRAELKTGNSARGIDGPFAPASNPAKNEQSIRAALLKLGESSFFADAPRIENPGNLFVPVSQINELRRQCVDDAEQQLRAAIPSISCAAPPARHVEIPARDFFSIKTDSLAAIARIGNFDELILDIAAIPPDEIIAHATSAPALKEKIRLALPVVFRAHETPGLRRRIAALASAGFAKWQGGNLAAFELIPRGADIAADWTLYAWNTRAIAQLRALGCASVALSPEMDAEAAAELLRQSPDLATAILRQDTPLMISESCPIAATSDSSAPVAGCGLCRGREEARFEPCVRRADSIRVISRNCRSFIINETPRDISPSFAALRAAGCRRWRIDFCFHKYSPEEAAEIAGNFSENLLR